MNNNHGLLNTTSFNLSDPQVVAEMVEVAKQMQAAVDSFYLYIKQEMQKQGTTKLEGPYGNFRFDSVELLSAVDARSLDPAFVKTTLDTAKAKDYRSLFGTLPEGVTSKTVTKFVKDVNRKVAA